MHVRYPIAFRGAFDEHAVARANAGQTVRIEFSLRGERRLDDDGVVTSTRIDCTSGTALGAPASLEG